MSIAAFTQADEHARFDPGPASRYPNHQTAEEVTAAASAFETDEQARPAFGKVNPYKLGVLPVLLIVENHSADAIRLDRIQVDYVGPDRQKIANTPAQELRFLNGARRPTTTPTPLPAGIPRIKKTKQPLSEWEIEGRAFSAQILPPGESASGFFYFQTGHRSGSTLYVSGLRNAKTGAELLYYELALENVR